MKNGKDRGMKKEVRGYWGDIVCSPYFSFGTDCDTPCKFSEGLFEIQNKNTGSEQHRHHAVEIAMYNLFQILWEIETGRVYTMAKANDIYSGLGAEPFGRSKKSNDVIAADSSIAKTGADEEDKESNIALTPDDLLTMEDIAPPTNQEDVNEGSSALPPPADEQLSSKEEEEEMAKALQRAECIVESFDGIQILPLCNSNAQVEDLLNKPKYTDANSSVKFDLIFVSNRMGKCIDKSYFKNLLRPHGGLLAVETGKYLVALDRKTKKALHEKEEEMCVETLGLRRLDPPPVRRRYRDDNETDHDVLFYSNK